MSRPPSVAGPSRELVRQVASLRRTGSGTSSSTISGTRPRPAVTTAATAPSTARRTSTSLVPGSASPPQRAPVWHAPGPLGPGSRRPPRSIGAMEVTRRQALTAVAGAAVGAAGAVGAVRVKERLDESTPLPFYGSPVSAVRPDRSPPSAAGASVVWSGPGDRRRVALTFDDGPHPDWTPRVLAALAAEDVPATFFCLGRNVRDHGDLHRGSVGRHELANHTFDHPDLGRHDWSRCRDEIERTTQLMKKTYGVAPTLFRPPYGHLGGAALLAATEAGLTSVLWSAQAREDLVAGRPDGIVDDIASQVRPAPSCSRTTRGRTTGSSPSTGCRRSSAGSATTATPSPRSPTCWRPAGPAPRRRATRRRAREQGARGHRPTSGHRAVHRTQPQR